MRGVQWVCKPKCFSFYKYSMKRISAAYAAALRQHGIKQAAFAAQNDLSSPDLTRVAQGQFPSDKILHAFAHGWPDAETGLKIMEAHLRDECERAGLKVTPRISPSDAADTLRDDIRSLEAFIPGTTDLAAGLQNLAERLRQPGEEGPSIAKPRKVTRRSK